MSKKKKSRFQGKITDKIRIMRVIAFIRLNPETLKHCNILKENNNCVRYKSAVIESPFNSGHRFFFFDHRGTSVSSVKKYKNHRRSPTNSPLPAVVEIMKKYPGGYYINIFQAPEGAEASFVLCESVVRSIEGNGFSVQGKPAWWVPGYMDGDKFRYISVDNLTDESKAITCTEIKSTQKAV